MPHAISVTRRILPAVILSRDFGEDSGRQVAANYLIYLVGAPRFELGTPSPPDWCANRAALRSEAKEMLGNSLS
jgi:hypothetical protein